MTQFTLYIEVGEKIKEHNPDWAVSVSLIDGKTVLVIDGVPESMVLPKGYTLKGSDVGLRTLGDECGNEYLITTDAFCAQNQ